MTLFDGTLIATSVVRGSQQGDSHGGVYLVNFKDQSITQTLDWNSSDIDFQGRGWDRGLRGVEFDGERVCIAASDELFLYSPDFQLLGSYRNRYLKHAHEIGRFGRNLFITSTGFNSVLAFDLDKQKFTWGLHINAVNGIFSGVPFDPMASNGPLPGNHHHLNNVHCDNSGMYLSGRGTAALLRFDGSAVENYASLPLGVHNARPFAQGLLYNHTEEDVVCYQSTEFTMSFPVPKYQNEELTHASLDDSKLARQGFGRGLCVLSDTVIAAGSSPSTITLYDIEHQRSGERVNLTLDVRNAIHGLRKWPYC